MKNLETSNMDKMSGFFSSGKELTDLPKILFLFPSLDYQQYGRSGFEQLPAIKLCCIFSISASKIMVDGSRIRSMICTNP